MEKLFVFWLKLSINIIKLLSTKTEEVFGFCLNVPINVFRLWPKNFETSDESVFQLAGQCCILRVWWSFFRKDTFSDNVFDCIFIFQTWAKNFRIFRRKLSLGLWNLHPFNPGEFLWNFPEKCFGKVVESAFFVSGGAHWGNRFYFLWGRKFKHIFDFEERARLFFYFLEKKLFARDTKSG